MNTKINIEVPEPKIRKPIWHPSYAYNPERHKLYLKEFDSYIKEIYWIDSLIKIKASIARTILEIDMRRDLFYRVYIHKEKIADAIAEIHREIWFDTDPYRYYDSIRLDAWAKFNKFIPPQIRT